MCGFRRPLSALFRRTTTGLSAPCGIPAVWERRGGRRCRLHRVSSRGGPTAKGGAKSAIGFGRPSAKKGRHPLTGMRGCRPFLDRDSDGRRKAEKPPNRADEQLCPCTLHVGKIARRSTRSAPSGKILGLGRHMQNHRPGQSGRAGKDAGTLLPISGDGRSPAAFS